MQSDDAQIDLYGKLGLVEKCCGCGLPDGACMQRRRKFIMCGKDGCVGDVSCPAQPRQTNDAVVDSARNSMLQCPDRAGWRAASGADAPAPGHEKIF